MLNKNQQLLSAARMAEMILQVRTFILYINSRRPYRSYKANRRTPWTLGPRKIISWIEPRFQALPSLSHQPLFTWIRNTMKLSYLNIRYSHTALYGKSIMMGWTFLFSIGLWYHTSCQPPPWLSPLPPFIHPFLTVGPLGRPTYQMFTCS